MVLNEFLFSHETYMDERNGHIHPVVGFECTKIDLTVHFYGSVKVGGLLLLLILLCR